MATTEEGYDVEALQEISSDLYCVICLKLMRNPVQFKCGHGMCYGCFKNLLQKTKQRNIAQCPQCREIVKENQAISNVMLHRLILSLKVRCVNNDTGCLWFGELDVLEEHLQRCSKSADANNTIAAKRTKKKKGKKIPAHTNAQSFQSDILLEITGQLSTLNDKIEQLEEEKDNVHSAHDSVDDFYGQFAFLFKSLVRKVRTTSKTSIVATNFLAMVMIIFLVWLSGISEAPSEHAPLDLKNLQKAFSLLHSDLSKIHSQIYAQQNNFFQLHLVSKELRSDFDAQKSSFEAYLVLFWKMQLHDLRYKKNSITEEIDDVMWRQLEVVTQIEKRFDLALRQLELEIQDQNRTLLKNAYELVAVPNKIHLTPNFLNETIRTVETTFFQELELSEYSAKTAVRQTFDRANEKFQAFHTMLEKTNFYEDVQQQLQQQRKEEKVKSDSLFKEKLGKDNMMKQIEGIQKYFFALKNNSKESINKLYVKYPPDTFSYDNRFKHAMQQLKNTNLKNGKYIWLMNSTLLPLLPGKHGYYSNEFTAIPSTSPYQPSKFAKLWLLKLSSDDQFWKVTYEQDADTNVTVHVSVLNQLRENDLNTVEVYRQAHDNKLQLIIDFQIPLTLPKLIEEGYIYNGKIFIRCVVQKPVK